MRGAYASLYYHIGGNMTPTDICNQALALINAGLLYSLEEETEQGRQCRMQYDPTRQLVLRQFEWNFAPLIKLMGGTMYMRILKSVSAF